ncbi:MAG: heme-binding protein [Myxococcales bacterium]|nr:heme-binding protein [Myxococcales bacterium]
MKKKLWITLLVSLILLVATAVAIAMLGGEGVAYETPKYRVVEAFGEIEIREYAPYLVAETTVDGDLESAGNRGFRILAKYIFGDNQGQRKIAMTAPVNQEKTEGTKIAMTAPVTQEKAGDKYTIQFMMPSEYSREDLPASNDPRIAIREIPARSFAAVRYSGTWSKRNYEKHLAQLLDTLGAEGYEPVGEPIWARYDPPFKPWFLRRNEILTMFRVTGSQR